MAFDLTVIQEDLKTRLKTKLPQFDFYVNQVPEDEELPRQGEEVPPFFVLQFGPLWPRVRGKSIAGPRNDDYYSWIQVIAVSSREEFAAQALALATDCLLGYRPTDGTALVPDGGMADYGSRQYSVRPVLFYQSQRFEFGVRQNGLNSYLTP